MTADSLEPISGLLGVIALTFFVMLAGALLGLGLEWAYDLWRRRRGP